MSLLPSRPDAEPAEDAGPRVIGVDDDEADDVLSALSSGTARRLLAALHDEPAPPSELAERVDTSLQNVQYHLEKLERVGAVEVVETAYSAKGREMDVYAAADRPLVIFAGDEERGSTLRTALGRLLGAVGLLALGSLLVQTLYGEGALLGGDGLAPVADGDGGGGGDVAIDAAGNATGGPTETEYTGATRTETAGDAAGTATETAGDTPTGAQIAEETTRATGTPSEAPAETAEATRTQIQTAAETVEAARSAATEGAAGLPPGLLFFAGGLFVLGVVAGVWYLGSRR